MCVRTVLCKVEAPSEYIKEKRERESVCVWFWHRRASVWLQFFTVRVGAVLVHISEAGQLLEF